MSVQSELPAAGGGGLQTPEQVNMVLTQLAANRAAPQVSGEGPLQMKNGLQKLSKRRFSMNAGFKHPGLGKRRRRATSESDPVLPSSFQLGGNIFDPLNLNSLMDEEVSRALNAETPKSSPLPSKSREPVEILIPKDITDPLNLSCADAAAGVLVSPMKSRRRHRPRHHPGPGADPPESEPKGEENPVLPPPEEPKPESPRPYELNTSINCRDEVVPPILPRRRSHPSSSNSAQSKNRKRRRTTSQSDHLSITTPAGKRPILQSFHTPVVGGASGAPPQGAGQTQQPRKPQRRFQHGNYSRYYGYRTPSLTADPRLALLEPEWFRGRKVLDVGCNTGHVTLAIARHWSPERILGLDIDGALVHVARQNLRHFLSELHQGSRADPGGSEVEGLAPLMGLQLDRASPLPRFPVSFTRCRGPIATPPIMPHTPGLFPCNVSFMKGNYVPDSDADVMSQRGEYDVILCLSLTKWVHLNSGDAGLQRLFRRIYRHLLPGGVLILEPQPWSSYSRRKRLTDVTYRNYCSIRLKPDQFSSFLTAEVGFSSYELIGTPRACAKGFQRSIYLFHKGPASSRK